MTASVRQKFEAVQEAINYRPGLAVSILFFSLLTALLEGVGVGFILPIIETARSQSPGGSTEGVMQIFVQTYTFLGLPFTLESLLLGVAAVMTLRYGFSFLVDWLQSVLTTGYQRHLRNQLFDAIIAAPIEYIDEAGSDHLINNVITEAARAGGVISTTVNITKTFILGTIYLLIAFILSPTLTLIALVALGITTGLVRYVLEPAYAVGDEVADVNDRIQTVTQSGIQGVRDVRLFNLTTEMKEKMRHNLDRYFDAGVRLRRNQAALNNLNQLSNAAVVFVLIYVSLRFTSLTLGELGVFLFAVFRLSPTLTQINNMLYSLDGTLPHLIQVQKQIDELSTNTDTENGVGEPVESVESLEFEDVSFSYYDDEPVLHNISFSVERGEHIALVGQSGAGKSTIVSLLGRLHSPDSGNILADDTPIHSFDLESWRERLAVVRQNPYIFDDTLKENLTIGNREASREEIENACRVAQITEFLGELPNGYETRLGENGVRLSGGQKQRVAIARALLKKDADLLVLDEATSELDSNIEKRVQQEIGMMEREYAIISIAHRLSTVKDADRIYALENGSIMEVGTHSELVENDGVYAELYATQSEG